MTSSNISFSPEKTIKININEVRSLKDSENNLILGSKKNDIENGNADKETYDQDKNSFLKINTGKKGSGNNKDNQITSIVIEKSPNNKISEIKVKYNQKKESDISIKFSSKEKCKSILI